MCVYAERERRKKYPLKTFLSWKNNIFIFFAAGDDGNEENGQGGVANDGFDAGSDSASVASGTSDKEAITMPTLEALEPESNGYLITYLFKRMTDKQKYLWYITSVRRKKNT